MGSFAGKVLILIGIILVIAGVILYYFPGRFNWIGNLPGDIKIVRGNFRLYIPVTSMLLISILLTLIVRIWRWLQ